MVQRHLAGTQGDDPPLGMVDLDHHLLAAREEIVFGEGPLCPGRPEWVPKWEADLNTSLVNLPNGAEGFRSI